MTEIRPIHAGESVAFLRLLCDVFSLDYARSSAVFFDEPMCDLNRKWALFDGSEMASILTTVPLKFGWGNGVGVAGVATKTDRQGQGLATQLLNWVLAYSERNDEPSAWLFARDPSLYVQCGFEPIDQVVRAKLDSEDGGDGPILNFREVRDTYDRWAMGDPSRLCRDERRWNFWKWNLKACTPFDDGYVCQEGNHVRECVVFNRSQPWRFSLGSEWFGLKSMASKLDLPLSATQFELHLMGRNASGIPQMFMTDQF